MELNINVLSDFVLNAEILWLKGLRSVDPVARQSGLFKEVPVPLNTGNTRKFTEIDLEEYAAYKAEGDQASRAKVQQGYSKEGTLYRVAKDIGITYEMRTQGKYLEVQSKLYSLGKLGMNRMELDLSHRLTFGHATSYTDLDGRTIDTTVGDTLALFSTAHTLRGSATTFRNILSGNPQFSQGSLEAMEKMRIENTFNQFGEKMSMRDDIIWSTDDPNTVRSIKQVLQSTSDVTQNNPGVVNTISGRYRHIMLPRIATTATGAVDSTKAKYWGLASSEMSSAYLGVHEEPRLKTPVSDNPEDINTDDWTFSVRAGWMIVIVAANWIAASKGDGTA